MAHVPGIEEFNSLVQRVEVMERENAFLWSVLLAQRWLTRAQTMKALDVSESTLWRLTKAETLISYGGKSGRYYDLNSIRTYLMGKHFTQTAAEKRVIDALYAVDPTKKPGLTIG